MVLAEGKNIMRSLDPRICVALGGEIHRGIGQFLFVGKPFRIHRHPLDFDADRSPERQER